jgi:pyrroloquinoline quinone biosynthesis protein E
VTDLKPLSLLAELTYRCNLQCPYCYNPLDLRGYEPELDRTDWLRVIDEAADLGVLQLHFSGGEPTLRADDLCALVAHARRRGQYVNLITQGTFLDEPLVQRLLDSGLDHVQLSVQAADAGAADAIAGSAVHGRKLAALSLLARVDVAVTLNCVLHRHNLDRVADVIALAESFGIRRVELANSQWYGWAFLNRSALMPTRSQVERASHVVARAQERLRGRMEIVYVVADYFEQYPKACMNGWGRNFITVAPDGTVLPCPAAAAVKTLQFENCRDRGLSAIWHDSAAFNAYRGTAWMPEPCRSCDRREVDWGGCRCQAYLLAGDAGVTDPACTLSPQHGLVEAERQERGESAPWLPRRSGERIGTGH